MVDVAIREWDKILLCASEASLTSWWVDDEIEETIQKERELSKKRGHKVFALIPLNLDGHLFNDTYQSGHKAVLARRLAANFTGWERTTRNSRNSLKW